MAVKARLLDLDGIVSLWLHVDEPTPELTEDEPDGWDASAPNYLLWDAELLERGIWRYYGLKAHLALLNDAHLDAVDRLNLPRIDLPELGLVDATVADALRRVKRAASEKRVVA